VAFVARFLAGAIAGLALLAWVPGITAFAVAQTTRHAASLAALLGRPLDVTGNVLGAGTLHLEIVPECTPLVPGVLVLSALLAYPASWRSRALGAALVIPALWVYNLIRVLVLVWVLTARPAWFEFIHVYVWQAVTLAVSAALFAGWVRLSSPTAPAPARA
jgi:exosortase/archaeosortase family protein